MALKMIMLFLQILALCRLIGRRVCFFETFASTYNYTWRQNPEQHRQHTILSSYYLDHNAINARHFYGKESSFHLFNV